MNNVTPWALCGSIFCVLPLIAFAAGYWFAKYGVEVRFKNTDANPLKKLLARPRRGVDVD